MEAALDGRRIQSASGVGGGCISPAARIQLADNTFCFLKWAAAPPGAAFFSEEARSLAALRRTSRIAVPAVLAHGERWLALEWLEPGRAGEADWAALGRQLAALHRVDNAVFGWEADNFIGSLPQANGWLDSWPGFWRDRRLRPQLERALAAGLLDPTDGARFDELFDRLPWLLAPAADDGPSLLHGDLWSGNVHMGVDGGALIDPSCYYGHREVDLAMARLFGGIDTAFFLAYDDAWPLAPDPDGARLAVYQLYYLLVHVNLFGGGYVAQTRAAVDRALGQVGGAR